MAVVFATVADPGVILQLWNTESWTPLPAQKPEHDIDDIAFSPDGSLLAEVNEYCMLTLRDAANGRVRRSIQLRPGFIGSIAFSPIHHELAVRYGNGFLELLDTVTMHVVGSMNVGTDDVYHAGESICFSPNGERLAVCGSHGFRVYSTAAWRLEQEINSGAMAVNVAFLADDQLEVIDGDRDRSCVATYDLETAKVSGRPKSTASVCAVAVSPVRKLVAIAGFRSKIQICEAGTGRVICAVHTYVADEPDTSEGDVPVLAFGPAGRIIATTVPEGIGIWNLDSLCGRVPRDSTPGPFLTMRDAAAPVFSPRGCLFAAFGNRRIDLWDTRTWRRVRSLRSDNDLEDGGTIAFSNDGRLVACGGDGFVELWEAGTGGRKLEMMVDYGRVRGLTFSPDGRTLAVSGYGMGIMLLSTRNGRLRRTIDSRGWEYALAYSPNARRLVLGNDDGAATWDTRTCRPSRGFSASGGDTIQQLSFSADGRYLAADLMNRWQIPDDRPAVVIWDAHSGQLLRRLDGQTLISQNAFSSDGRFLMTTGPDGRMETWNTRTWRLDRAACDPRPMNAAAISPNGSLIAGTDDDTVDLMVTIWKRPAVR